MAVTLQVVSGEGEGREVRLGPGDSLELAPDSRAELQGLALGEVELAVTEADALAMSSAGETFYLTGLIEHLENEAGATLVFADGEAIDTLGALLAALGNGARGTAADALARMSDLIAEDGYGGDVVYLDLGSPATLAGVATDEGKAPLDIGEVLDTNQTGSPLDTLAGDAVAPALGQHSSGGGSWADTEAAELGAFVVTPPDVDVDGLIISSDPNGLA
jgi:hypothetical protein